MASIIRTRSQERIAAAAEEEALLAAVQRQAEEEEAIGGRLPREVLYIRKRMEQQQSSMEQIHANLSSLTEMVSQISVSVGKQPANHTPPVTTGSPSTPEAHPQGYQPNLSLIPEGSTPMNQSSSTQATARPLQFGNLSPRHLSHPEFSNSASASNQASIPPKSPPFTSAAMSAPQTTQAFQHTNPQAQPQYYNYPNSQIFPQNPQPFLSYNPPTPPQYMPNLPYPPYQQPFSTYPPPIQNHQVFLPLNQNPHFTYSHTQPSIPHTPRPPPYTTSNTQSGTFEQRNVEPHIRSPTVELPLFYGDNAYQWLQDCEGIFELAAISPENKIKWAAAHIHGKAKTWLNSANFNLHFVNWTQFCQLLLERFPDAGQHESMDQFQHLRQHTTVGQYIDAFEEWMIMMKRDHGYLTAHFFTLRFLSGLKDPIKHAVKCHQPPDLRTAYWCARQEELVHNSVSKRQPATNTSMRTTIHQAHNKQGPFRDNRVRPPADKTKEKGKCWYCPEDWFLGHRCAGVKSMIHAIQMQGHSDDEEEQEEVAQPEEQVQENVPEPAAALPNPGILNQPVPNGDNIHQLSMEALHGIPGEGTITIQIHIDGQTALALVDTGSTNTFLDKDFAAKLTVPTTPIPQKEVLVAGGGHLQSNSMISNCKFQI